MTFIGPAQPSLTDILLADVAAKVQLTKTEYDNAVQRYRAINDYLDREGSPLRGKVALMYPQGSMAMGCTISSSLDNDEFDIDLISELVPEFRQAQPRDVLNLYFIALDGDPGSRYHGKVVRHTRCVTVHYAGMHLDVTPAVLLPGRPKRVSHVFHSKLERPRVEDQRVVANPWGFAEWFKDQLPDAPGSRVSLSVLAKRADAMPVDDQPRLFERSLPLLALQLIKRWRNKNYDGRPGRCPPSVLLACLVGERSGSLLRTGHSQVSLFHALTDLVAYIRGEFEKARIARTRIQRLNPACPEDEVLTDRWPGAVADQDQFIADLDEFRAKLAALANPGLDLPARDRLLSNMFGERVTRLVLEEFRKRLGEKVDRGELLQRSGTGSIILASPVLTAVPTSRPVEGAVQRAPAHKFFGSLDG